ncbi:MAG: NADH-quinone oxidoreductase subunit C [Anaerolineales bacterium]|nr:NADH-quinone oxidoreductase subunit C [Anaerolineales bacterium]
MSEAEATLSALKQELEQRVLDSIEFRDQLTAVLPPEAVVEACQFLKQRGYDLLIGLTASDHWPELPRFEMLYQLFSTEKNSLIGLSVRLEGEEPKVPSIESVYRNANWHEREVFDMFGIDFPGHSDLRRILMPMDWEGHPLRRDYPLGYEEVQFTFNFDEIEKRKKYAQE